MTFEFGMVSKSNYKNNYSMSRYNQKYFKTKSVNFIFEPASNT